MDKLKVLSLILISVILFALCATAMSKEEVNNDSKTC
jgi:PBP1b-binding outer membrane lipoprotein LpoB